MIKSMTGFGRCEKITKEYKVSVEIKSVNHRYCDISIKLPRKLNAFEADIRNILKEYITRGKVDVYISYEDYTSSGMSLMYNRYIAADYVNCIKELGKDFDIPFDLTASMLSRYPEILTLEENRIDDDKLFARISEAVREACGSFVAARTAEGANLKKDILEKLNFISECVDYIVERSPEIIEDYRQKLYEKVSEVIGNTQIEQSVLATELVVYADKICVDEEMVRLKSHIDSMKNVLESDESIGRKLDFIAQELNREANTTLSKSSDVRISGKAIELKTEIEKVREQIQNIE